MPHDSVTAEAKLKVVPLPPADEAAEINRLSKLNALQYERERERAAERLGVRVSALDKEVEGRRTPAAGDLGGYGRSGSGAQSA